MMVCVVTGYAPGDASCALAPNYTAASTSSSYYMSTSAGSAFALTSGANVIYNCGTPSIGGSAAKGYTLVCNSPTPPVGAVSNFYYGLYIGNTVSTTIDSGNITASTTTCAGTGVEQCALQFYGPPLSTGPALSLAGGTYNFYGGVFLKLSGSTKTVSEQFGTGTYYITAHTGDTNIDDPSAGGAIVVSSNDIVNFAGGTYYIDGGITVNGTAYFGPGIYYIRNGDLLFTQSSQISADGATFVLEASPTSSKYNAAYVMTGNVGFTMIAPGMGLDSYSSQPCVQPAAYVAGATNGEGICGILFYQARNDPAADSAVAGAGGSGKSNTIDGEIYAPSAPLTMSGTGSLTAGSSQTFGMVQYTVNSGTTGGILKLQAPTNGNSPIVGSTTAQPYLVK
jgi:hypothetical protein